MAFPAVTITRLAKVPTPYGIAALSPVTTSHIFEIDAKIIGADLAERGLLALPLRCRAGEDVDLAVGADLDAAALVGTEPGSFDVGCDADAEANAALPLRQLRFAEVFVTDHFSASSKQAG